MPSIPRQCLRFFAVFSPRSSDHTHARHVEGTVRCSVDGRDFVRGDSHDDSDGRRRPQGQLVAGRGIRQRRSQRDLYAWVYGRVVFTNSVSSPLPTLPTRVYMYKPFFTFILTSTGAYDDKKKIYTFIAFLLDPPPKCISNLKFDWCNGPWFCPRFDQNMFSKFRYLSRTSYLIDAADRNINRFLNITVECANEICPGGLRKNFFRPKTRVRCT